MLYSSALVPKPRHTREQTSSKRFNRCIPPFLCSLLPSRFVLFTALMEWSEGQGLLPAQAVPCAAPSSAEKGGDDGVWVFVPVNAPADQLSVQADSRGRAGPSGKLKGFLKGQEAGARNWLASRLGAVLPMGQEKSQGSIACAARTACAAVAERPEILAACLIGGAGLATLATRVLLQGGFVYCCFVPHFIFNSGGSSTSERSGGCEHCRACGNCSTSSSTHSGVPTAPLESAQSGTARAVPVQTASYSAKEEDADDVYSMGALGDGW
jgi:hypothetical protein